MVIYQTSSLLLQVCYQTNYQIRYQVSYHSKYVCGLGVGALPVSYTRKNFVIEFLPFRFSQFPPPPPIPAQSNLRWCVPYIYIRPVIFSCHLTNLVTAWYDLSGCLRVLTVVSNQPCPPLWQRAARRWRCWGTWPTPGTCPSSPPWAGLRASGTRGFSRAWPGWPDCCRPSSCTPSSSSWTTTTGPTSSSSMTRTPSSTSCWASPLTSCWRYAGRVQV